ncbi:MAG: peptidylprolyl isomerase [Candidatus Muiribacteriota bacterium]
MKFRNLSVLVLIVAMIFTGCGQKETTTEVKASDSNKGNVSSSLQGAPGDVLAKFDGVTITRADFMSEIEKIPAEQKAGLLSSPEGLANLFERFVEFKIVTKKIEDTGYINTIANEIEAIKENLVVEKFVELKRAELSKNIKITDAEIESFYKNNEQEFVGEEEVHASHILIADGDGAKEKLLDIKKEITSGKISFEEAAMNYSTCPSKAQGGDLGFFGRGRMVPEFEKAAFLLSKGQISDPVKTQFGWHLILCNDTKDGKTASLASVKTQIQKRLSDEKVEHAFEEWKESVMSKADLKIDLTKKDAVIVNGKVVATNDEIDAEINKLPEYMREYYGMAENKIAIAEMIAEKQIYFEEAKKINLHEDKTILASLTDNMKNYVFNRYITDFISEKSVVTDAELNEYYKNNNKMYSGKFIFLSKMDKDIDTINNIIAEIEKRAQKEDFDVLIKEYSDDPSAQDGGDLGQFMKDDMFPALADKIGITTKGGTTGFVELPDGFANIKIVDMQEMPLETIRERLLSKLKSQKQNDAYDDFMESIRAEYNLEIMGENI